ncbi:MAG: hypothetical protein ABI868_11685 [Acidobacteriota bacterium]
MKSSLKTITFAIAAAACLGAGTVSAAPPANLANTVWTMQINRVVDVLTITSQSGPGAPGAATCRFINGTFGIANIRGWYCPATGRIHFVHKNAGSGNAVRVFTGNLSDETLDPALFMSGTVTVLDAAFGDLGEFNFSGTT